MSATGCCYDNTVMKSFFPKGKVRVHGETSSSKNEASSSIGYYIEAYYNRKRRHSAISIYLCYMKVSMVLPNPKLPSFLVQDHFIKW
jgi:hypothetical protein